MSRDRDQAALLTITASIDEAIAASYKLHGLNEMIPPVPEVAAAGAVVAAAK